MLPLHKTGHTITWKIWKCVLPKFGKYFELNQKFSFTLTVFKTQNYVLCLYDLGEFKLFLLGFLLYM